MLMCKALVCQNNVLLLRRDEVIALRECQEYKVAFSSCWCVRVLFAGLFGCGNRNIVCVLQEC